MQPTFNRQPGYGWRQASDWGSSHINRLQSHILQLIEVPEGSTNMQLILSSKSELAQPRHHRRPAADRQRQAGFKAQGGEAWLAAAAG